MFAKTGPFIPFLFSFGVASADVMAQEPNDDEQIEKIEVRGELLPTLQDEAANAVDIVSKAQFERIGAAHVQDILAQMGNINFSSGSSRARFIQIRGICERSQFVYAINPSVGLAIDGIDYSGLGTVATTFDIEQLELFKGPQGTNIGANAMAGYLNLYSVAPGDSADKRLMLELGNYGLVNLGAAYGGNFNDDNSYRVSINKLDGDGYIDNTYLNREDTNGFDELAIRAQIKNIINDDWALTTVVHHFDTDNGYDAFSLDNTRETLSDNPGFDRQETQSVAVTSYFRGLEQFNNKVFFSVSQSDTDYGYDEDWAHPNFYPNYEADYGYNSVDAYFRNYDNMQLDVALSGKDDSWVSGLYFQQKSIDLNRLDIFSNQYDVTNVALYGEKRFEASKQLELSAGLRLEHYAADYSDSVDTNESTDEVMVGGHLSAINKYSDNLSVYVRISHGFKPGGVNGEALSKRADPESAELQLLLAENADFSTETLNNLEMGIRGSSEDNTLTASATLFYSARDNMQVRQWITNQDIDTGDEVLPPIFISYISNVAHGVNYGFETSVTYKPNYDVTVSAGFSLLETEIRDTKRRDFEETTQQEVLVDIDGRAQAHAPGYQYFLTGAWRLTDRLEASVSFTGKDKYFYSISHDQEADAVDLVNASLKYIGDSIDITLWARNITDEDYGVRGFYFGNDPRNGYTSTKYEQLGEPAVVGVRVDYVF